MKDIISILGCGWLGIPLGQNLLNLGYDVNGSTRSIERFQTLKQSGIEPFIINISELNKNLVSFFDTKTLVISITSKSIDDFKNLIKIIEQSKIENILYISSTSVYNNNNNIVTEKEITNDSILAQIERLFIENSHFKTTIVRFGGLFGYQRKPGNFIKPPRVIKNPEGFINLIHQDDCVSILSEIIIKNVWDEVFNACSSHHPQRKEFYQNEVYKLHGIIPDIDQDSLNQYKIISSKKLLNHLSYKFKYDNLVNF